MPHVTNGRLRWNRLLRGGKAAAVLLGVLTATLAAEADEPLGVQAPDGFEVTLYADDDLAHDIYSMTIDSLGRVVVSGAGYVRILEDTDGDGRADAAKQFVDGPQNGAQGMHFYGRDLLCSGDAGLIRYRDENGDDVADGPPDVFLKIKTGGEHDLHAIRRGPDGWFYVIAGNMAGVDDRFATEPTSPISAPYAGTVMRLKPNLTGGEVVADGLRNAYDFDFGTQGDLFTFDSDGERDISLPWYRPTRLFQLVPGSNAGWVERSWKRPDYFLDMLPVVGEFGRGSPTGVVCYRHTQFPRDFHGALFILDWTYGRVMAVELLRDGSSWRGNPIDFLTAVGQHGFAPTDAAVGPDGSLYVSVGGRGTRGSVYRVRSTESPPVELPDASPTLPTAAKLELCLTAPQPLASWSRRRWEPLAMQIGRDPFVRAALDERRATSQRVRAIEILTEKFNGLQADEMQWLTRSAAYEVRARAAWSVGRTQTELPSPAMLQRGIVDSDPLVARVALEALIGAKPEAYRDLVQPIARGLGNDDRHVRQAAERLLTRLDEETYHAVAQRAVREGWQAAIPLAQGFADRKSGFSAYTVDIGVLVLEQDLPTERKLEAARLIQIGLGDLGPAEVPEGPVFTGYAPQIDLEPHAEEIAPLVERIAAVYPTGDSQVDHELARVLAMIRPDDSELVTRLLAEITEESHPTDDLHRLIVLARLPAERTAEQRAKTAHALLNIDRKVEERELRQDSQWPDRTMELYTALVARDPELPVALLEHEDFGRPGHVLYVVALPPERFGDAIAVFVEKVKTDDDYEWNNDVVFLLGAAQDPEVRTLLRERGDDYSLRNPILVTLSQEPTDEDRPLFIAGLEGTPTDVMGECIKALALLDPSDAPEEVVALVRALRRLGYREEERELRDQVVELLRLRTGEGFGYELGRENDPQQASIDQWTAWAEENFAEEFAKQSGATVESLEELKNLIAGVDWDAGDPARGETLFIKRQCAQCHNSRTALGPDLTGAAGRFSREDLFTAIALPNKDVSPRYQTTTILTEDGKVHTGLIVYESVDGLVLRNARNQTLRFEEDEIEEKRTISTSIMPTGLLKDLTSSDLADLYAYLRQLGVRTADNGEAASGGE